MLQKDLVSIIIPTYNRAHLISETLDSILQQTYEHWECIVVDDGSTDATAELLNSYIAKDSRFQYYHRPENTPRGGNAARNFGFTKSKGGLIQWFDSDDLLVPTKIETKVDALQQKEADFVISKTKYFNKPDAKLEGYNFTESEVTFDSFAMGGVSWFTPDMLIRRTIAEKITFLEELRAGQEYNYVCKLLLQTEKMAIVDEYLTLRRYTENSIGTNRRKSELAYLQSRLDSYWKNYKDVYPLANNANFDQHALLTCLSAYYQSGRNIKLPDHFKKELKRVFGRKSVYFHLANISHTILNKYHYFYNKLK